MKEIAACFSGAVSGSRSDQQGYRKMIIFTQQNAGNAENLSFVMSRFKTEIRKEAGAEEELPDPQAAKLITADS
jgi:hypothetical protein